MFGCSGGCGGVGGDAGATGATGVGTSDGDTDKGVSEVAGAPAFG